MSRVIDPDRARCCGHYLPSPSLATVRRLGSAGAHRLFGCLEWIPEIRREDVVADVVSGIVCGVMLLPQSLSYANVLEVPLTVGLNAGVVSGVAYAIFGKIPYLSVGAAAESTAFLLTVVSSSGPQREADILMFAVFSGIVGMVASFLRGGRLIKILLNRPVGDGYAAATALLVNITLLKSAFNLKGKSTSTLHDTVSVLISGFRDQGSLNNLYSFLLFAAYAGYLYVVRFFPKIPSWMPHQLIVVIVSTLITFLADLESRINLSIVQSLPPKLPQPSFPTSASVSGGTMINVVVLALICFLQNFTIATSGSANVDADQEMWASGAVNFAAGLFGGFPVLGGFGRSGVLRDRNAKSSITHLVASLLMLVTLAGLTRLDVFYFLPNHALAAIIFVAMLKMIDVTIPLRLWRVNTFDLLVWVTTFILTLFTSITIGILTGMGLSLVFVIFRIARPHTTEIGYSPTKGIFVSIKSEREALVYPRVLLWRFEAPLYFVNLNYFESRLKSAIRKEARPIDVVVIDCAKILDIDAAGLSNLALTVRNVEYMNPSHPRTILLAQVPHHLRALLVKERQAEMAVVHSDSHLPLVLKEMSATKHHAADRLVLLSTLHEAIGYARAAVHDRVSSHDNLSSAPRPSVAFLTDLYLKETSGTAGDCAPTSALDSPVVGHEPLGAELFPSVDVPAFGPQSNGKQRGDRALRILKNSTFDETQRELVGCLGVFRHADRTPKQKLKLVIVGNTELRALAVQAGDSKMRASELTAVYVSVMRNALVAVRALHGSSPMHHAARLLQLLEGADASLTWQLKLVADGKAAHHANDDVTVIAKWGGVLTAVGRSQATKHGLRLVPRFFACGDLPLERIEPFRSSVAVTAANEDRVVETAVATVQALTEDSSFSAASVRLNDALLNDASCAAPVVAAASEHVRRLLHCRSTKDLFLLRHLPGVMSLVTLQSVPRRCDPCNGLTPLDVVWYAYELMVEVAGGAGNVARAQRDGEAATDIQCPDGVHLTLSECEGADGFHLRWSVLAATFAPRHHCGMGSRAADAGHDDESTTWPFADSEPFDTSSIQKLADYLDYDMEHNFQILVRCASTASLAHPGMDAAGEGEPSCPTPSATWAGSVASVLVRLDPVVRALARVTGPLGFGLSQSERFVCGALMSGPLFSEIRRKIDALIEQDILIGTRASLQRWLTKMYKLHHVPHRCRRTVDECLPLTSSATVAPTALIHLYFGPSSHVVGLQHCLLSNPTVLGFRCADEYQHQGLGYMTHVVFKVFRVVHDQDIVVEPPTPDAHGNLWDFTVPTDEEGRPRAESPSHEPSPPERWTQLLASLTPLWRRRHRYSVEVFLSTGMHVVAEAPQHDLGTPCVTGAMSPTVRQPDRLATTMMSMVKIHEGLTVRELDSLCEELQLVRAVYCAAPPQPY